MFNDILKGIGTIAGIAIGTVGGVSIAVIALTLGVTEAAVEAAVEAGCTTIEEIEDFLNS